MSAPSSATDTDDLPTWTPSRRWDEGPVLVCLAAVVLAALWTGLAFAPSPPGEDSAAVGFARDMRVHHEQAVVMAEIMRDRTDDPALRLLATDIALTQQAQIGRMHGWLDTWGMTATSSEPAMAWMGEPTDGLMPGMASRAMVRELAELPLGEAERRFLSLMVDHHRGGVAMAQGVLDHDVPGQVTTLAEAIVMSQRSEVEVMRQMLAERGATPPPAPAPALGEAASHGTADHHAGLQLGDVFNWAFPGAGVMAFVWLAVDASRRRRAWQGSGQGLLVLPLLAGFVAAASAAAGVLHLALTPAHLETGLGAGVVFLVAALAQLGLAGAVWAWPRRALVIAAAAVSAALIVIYLLFRVVPPPGAAASEAVDAVGLAVLGLQLAVIFAAGAAQRRMTVVSP